MIDESVKAKIYELEEAATKDYNDSPYLDEYLEGYRDGLHQAAKELSTAPTVDAVPVVRCGECIHRYVDGENVRFNVCELNHNKVQADDWFCADGERRTE